MSRLPTNTDRPSDFARHSFDEWQALDGYYSYWTDRWKRTLDFVRGQHWHTLKEYDRDVLPDWRSFPLINFTLAFYNDYLSDFLKQNVRYSAVPVSADPQDIDAAELSENVLKYLWNRLNYDKKRIDLGAWLMSCGTGVLRHYWNTNTGDVVPLGIPQPQGGIMPVDPETFEPAPGAQPEMVDRGEIGVEVVSPQFVRWARSPSDGVMIGLLLTYDEAASFYGEDTAEKLSYSDTHQGISSNLNHIDQPGVTPRSDERALVIEHYIPPSSRHPQGLWWTAAQNGRELLTGPWALPAGRIPVTSFRWVPIPGDRNLGISPLYDMTFQDKIYEEITAKILEWYNKAKPKWMLKAGGGIAAGDFTDEPWQQVVVNQGGEPEAREIQDAPQGLFNMLEATQRDMSMVSGKQFREEDQLPEGLLKQSLRVPETKSGSATALAQINSKASWREVGEVLLSYVAEFYNEPRVMTIQGPDQGFLWREFKGQDLTRDGNLAATIRVDERPLFPWSRQNMRDTVLGLLQSQGGQILFSDESGEGLDMEKIDRALNAVGLGADMDSIDPDTMEARNEEIAFRNMRQGEDPPQVRQRQNHQAHQESHANVMKSQRFRSWEPHQRQAFVQHVEQHEQILNQQAEQERDAMIEQERRLREVREEAELRANIMEEWATELIGILSEVQGIDVEDILQIVGQAEEAQGTIQEARQAQEGGEESESE